MAMKNFPIGGKESEIPWPESLGNYTVFDFFPEKIKTKFRVGI